MDEGTAFLPGPGPGYLRQPTLSSTGSTFPPLAIDERIPETGVVQPQFRHLPLQPPILGFEIIQTGTFRTVGRGRSGSPPVEGTPRNTVLLTDHLDRGGITRSKDPLSLIVCILRPFSGYDSHSRNPGEVLQVRFSGRKATGRVSWGQAVALHSYRYGRLPLAG